MIPDVGVTVARERFEYWGGAFCVRERLKGRFFCDFHFHSILLIYNETQLCKFKNNFNYQSQ